MINANASSINATLASPKAARVTKSKVRMTAFPRVVGLGLWIWFGKRGVEVLVGMFEARQRHQSRCVSVGHTKVE
jgi:hypothetical protein